MPELPWPDPPLTDSTVVLRRWREDDIARIVAICQDPAIARWTRVPTPYTERDAREWLDMHERARQAGQALPFAVTEAGSGRVLGSVGVVDADHEDLWAEIGYWTAPEARGRGTMTRAVTLLGGWLLREVGFARVQMVIAAGNRASQRVAEKAGFVREGVLRSLLRLDGERHDAVVFSLLPGELP